LILAAIISSLTKGTLAPVVGLETAREAWQTLGQHFASQSQARLMQTKLQLATMKKGATSTTNYFQKAQSFAQTLAAIGQPIPDS
jgi:hypothetical protein